MVRAWGIYDGVMSSHWIKVLEASPDFQRALDRGTASTSVCSLLSVLHDSRQDCIKSTGSPVWNRFPLSDCRSGALPT